MIPLPYDNLQKFLAVLGLALVMGGGGFAYSTYSERSQEQLKVLDETRPSREELYMLQELGPDATPRQVVEQVQKLKRFFAKHNLAKERFEAGSASYKLKLAAGAAGVLAGLCIGALGIKGWAANEKSTAGRT